MFSVDYTKKLYTYRCICIYVYVYVYVYAYVYVYIIVLKYRILDLRLKSQLKILDENARELTFQLL